MGSIYQTFGGAEVYPSVEEKAANLLYFVTKNHSFTDGNKRIAATMFLYFLEKNGMLLIEGTKIIDDYTLVAITIMIAESKPDEKETMVKLVMNFLN
ncbi:MAG: Fic family protein [Lachnospiraceae bacterium]